MGDGDMRDGTTRDAHAATSGRREHGVARALRDLARLVLPVDCAGCGQPDVPLCADCSALFADTPRRCEDDAPRLDRLDGRPPLPVWTLAPYTGPVRELVVAWKDRGRADVGPHLVAPARQAARVLAPVLLDAVVRAAGEPGIRLLVVPAPSAAASRRARGRDPVRELACAVVQGLEEGFAETDGGVRVTRRSRRSRSPGAGPSVRVAPVLVQRGRLHDQVGLGSRDRGRKLAGALRLARSADLGKLRDPVTVCLLVDDVLTTGATLAACEAALVGEGARVMGAFTLAATPPPSSRSTSAGTSVPVHLPLVLPQPTERG